MKIPISTIIISERQRLDLGDMADLDSMGEPSIGQLQPIGVTDKNVLLWGRRRLEKARTLGWTEIEATVRSGVSPTEAQLIEYAEDAERKNRTWQEECLALFKLDHMKKLEDGFGYGGWTIRKMTAFTGFSKGKVGYMLQVAEELKSTQAAANEGKETIWSCASVTDATKYVVALTEKKLYAEIERRRQIGMSAVTVRPIEDRSGIPDEESSASLPSDVQQLAKTPDEIVVHLHGRKMTYDEDTEWKGELSHLVLGYNVIPDPTALRTDLRENGFAVLWFDLVDAVLAYKDVARQSDLFVMPFPLIWNKIRPDPNIGWPFCSNYANGLVIARKEQILHGDPVSAVVSAIQDDPTLLPVAVVDACLTPIVLQNMAVTIIGGIDPLDIIQLGRVPIWYEPDEERFNSMCVRLEEHYAETIPNVRVVV